MHSNNGATTNSCGSIQYVDPYYSSDGSNPKRKRAKLKHATRWPRAEPLKMGSGLSASEIKAKKRSIDKQAWVIFQQRYAGQKPKKGQLKAIRNEIAQKRKSVCKKKLKEPRANRGLNTAIAAKENSQDKIDKLTIGLFQRRNPGRQPQKGELCEIRKEIIERRKQVGL